MKKKLISIGIILIFLIVGFSGCLEEKNIESDEKNTYNGKSEYGNNLTDEDWDYFVFHYNSGKDLNNLFTIGFDIIDTQISLFDPVNSSFLLEINNSNKNILYQLNNISNTMNSNISLYNSFLNNFTLSSNMVNHSFEQKKLLNAYQNYSYAFLSIYNKIIANFNPSIEEYFFIDISEEMAIIFYIEGLIVQIMNNQVEIIVNIPNEIWDKWENNDWSFMES